MELIQRELSQNAVVLEGWDSFEMKPRRTNIKQYKKTKQHEFPPSLTAHTLSLPPLLCLVRVVRWNNPTLAPLRRFFKRHFP